MNRIILVALLLGGCAQQQSKSQLELTLENDERGRVQLRKEIEELKAESATKCERQGYPQIGMTKAQVFKTCWGETGRINRTQTADGIFEQYVYSDTSYLYFRNGILTSIQN